MSERITKIVYKRLSPTDDILAPKRRVVREEVGCGVKIGRARSRRGARNSIFSLIAITLILSLSTGLSRAGSTSSFFSDNETSAANVFNAGSLDFTVNTDGSLDAYVGLDATGSKTILPIVTPVAGSFPLEYKVTVQKTSGSDNFCNSLHALATTSPFIYDGKLISLSTGPTTSTNNWNLEISLPSLSAGIKQGDMCSVDIIYSGWRNGGLEGQGYQDQEKVSLTFHARMVVLNEFLPDPDTTANGLNFGDDSDLKPLGEWVELYNNSTSTVDLAGWKVGNGTTLVTITAGNTVPAGTTIASNSWLAVYLNSALLDNTADTVRLVDPFLLTSDSQAYSGAVFCSQTPTPDASNPGDASGSCVVISGNKSFARIPDGTGAWVDPIPTPGFANTLELTTPEQILEFTPTEPPVIEPNNKKTATSSDVSTESVNSNLDDTASSTPETVATENAIIKQVKVETSNSDPGNSSAMPPTENKQTPTEETLETSASENHSNNPPETNLQTEPEAVVLENSAPEDAPKNTGTPTTENTNAITTEPLPQNPTDPQQQITSIVPEPAQEIPISSATEPAAAPTPLPPPVVDTSASSLEALQL